MSNQNLYILAGIPGAGKSSFATALLQPYAGNTMRVSSDEIRKREFGSLKAAHDPAVKKENNTKVWTIFHDKIDDYLKNQWSVIADATFLTRPARDKARLIGEKYHAQIHLILFKNVTQAEQRNSQRSTEDFVPDEAMEFMFKKYYDTLTELPQEKYDTVTKIESFA